MKQSEIWLTDLEPTKGAEIQKRRPAVIVNNNSLGYITSKDYCTDYRLERPLQHCTMDD